MKIKILHIFTRFATIYILALSMSCVENNIVQEQPDDCAGVIGGNAVLDSCNVCDDDPANDCVEDCAGIWGGSAVLDSCNVCDDDPANDCVEDCAGIWGGSAVLDSCGVCDDNPENDCLANMHFSPVYQSIGINENASLEMVINGLSEPIFAMSMQISYNSSILSFNDSTGFSVGEFFGDQNIVFVNVDNSIIYISMSIQQGNSAVDGAGTISTLTFKGSSSGTSEIEISLSDLHFFDSGGNEISTENFETVPAMITVNP
jgi:hypothetical protein